VGRRDRSGGRRGAARRGRDAYYRIAWPVLVVAAPVMGGAFTMFLPFIGAAMLVRFVAADVTGRRGLRQGAART